jgi:hypothetical protein
VHLAGEQLLYTILKHHITQKISLFRVGPVMCSIRENFDRISLFDDNPALEDSVITVHNGRITVNQDIFLTEPHVAAQVFAFRARLS